MPRKEIIGGPLIGLDPFSPIPEEQRGVIHCSVPSYRTDLQRPFRHDSEPSLTELRQRPIQAERCLHGDLRVR
jgi:hypothetical protein